MIPHSLSNGKKGIPQDNFPFDTVQHSVHQSQSVSIMYQLTADKGLFPLKFNFLWRQVKIVIRFFPTWRKEKPHWLICAPFFTTPGMPGYMMLLHISTMIRKILLGS
jgi:hypothetical protein